MRKEILASSPSNDPKFDKLPHSRGLVWQQITSGKHYSLEYVSRGILQPWVNVVTELAREAAKSHYKGNWDNIYWDNEKFAKLKTF